jgi:dihydroneopterin aldolase
MSTNITVGIEKLRFSLAHKCKKNPKKSTKVCLSLRLMGNFLPAALSDKIFDTVDYEALCQHIEKALNESNCASYQKLLTTINTAISNFSSLITGGYISLTVKCHDTFTAEAAFDIGSKLISEQ